MMMVSILIVVGWRTLGMLCEVVNRIIGKNVSLGGRQKCTKNDTRRARAS